MFVKQFEMFQEKLWIKEVFFKPEFDSYFCHLVAKACSGANISKTQSVLPTFEMPNSITNSSHEFYFPISQVVEIARF